MLKKILNLSIARFNLCQQSTWFGQHANLLDKRRVMAKYFTATIFKSNKAVGCYRSKTMATATATTNVGDYSTRVTIVF